MPSNKKSTSAKTAAKRARTPKKTAAAAAPEPAPEPVVVAPPEPEPVQQVVATETATEEVSLDEQFRLITQRLQEHRAMGASILADVRRLQKSVQAMSVNQTARTADVLPAAPMVPSALPADSPSPLSSLTLSASSSAAHQELKWLALK